MTANVDRLLPSLDNLRPLYILPSDPLAEEVLIPGFRVARMVDCMVGFFTSDVLASLAPGLATYINNADNTFRLIVSPLLRSEDQAAIEDGVRSEEEVASTILEDLIITEDLIEQHTLRCLSWLLQKHRIEIRVALMKDALFHPKVWLFDDEDNTIAAHGSCNVTYSGIRKNIEQIAISCSWQDPNQRYITNKLRHQFERLWKNREDICVVIKMPEAIRRRILHTYRCDSPPVEDDLRDLYERAQGVAEELKSYQPIEIRKKQFKIPDYLRFEDGPYGHQGKAVAAWCESGYRGILEMATGSGKTITAMICAHRLYESTKPLLIVVTAPYVPLIKQWCDEIVPFGLEPINLVTVGSATRRSAMLQKLGRRLRTGLSNVEVVVVSHDTLCSDDFCAALRRFDCSRLLVGDEVHNLGRASFIDAPPEFFEHRLGLSATPIRQYDQEGTDALLQFFGSVIFQYTLEEAIGNCLVEYDYYVHPVYLTETEMDEWFELTGKIKKNAWRADEDESDTYLLKLFRERRALLETAANKLPTLEALLDKEDASDIQHTLIYTSDKGPEQLQHVNRLLRDRNILFHQLTAEETANRDRTTGIIRSFQNGDLQVLTAKRVLDEGVNIPEICRAFILASTTVERQWVQRRGRLLRTCKAIGKNHSVIHDLLALPPGMDEELDLDARSLVRSELRRALEFASLARNAGRPDGPAALISKLVDAAYL